MQWNDLSRGAKPVLHVHEEGAGLRVVDTRPCAIQSNWTITGVAAQIYRLCDSAQTMTALKTKVDADLNAGLDTLLKNKVMLAMHDKLLAIGTNSARSV